MQYTVKIQFWHRDERREIRVGEITDLAWLEESVVEELKAGGYVVALDEKEKDEADLLTDGSGESAQENED